MQSVNNLLIPLRQDITLNVPSPDLLQYVWLLSFQSFLDLCVYDKFYASYCGLWRGIRKDVEINIFVTMKPLPL